MKIRRFYFTKESDLVRNVRREDSDGPWCRYEDVEPLLERIKVLEKQKQVLENNAAHRDNLAKLKVRTRKKMDMTKEELEFQIATEKAFIKMQRAAQDHMRNLEAVVRSSNVIADLAAFDLIILFAKDRIAEHEKKIEELENEM